jgi:hypothetical protein
VAAGTPVGAGNAIGAVLFLNGYFEFFNLAGAFLSSPWTMESFGGDPGKNASARGYVRKTVVRGAAVSYAGVLISGMWWPLIGTAIAAADLWLTYNGALNRSEKTGSVGWQSPSGQGWRGLAW